MNKRVCLIILAVAIVVSIGGIGMFWSKKNDAGQQKKAETVVDWKTEKILPETKKEEQQVPYVEHQVLCSAKNEKDAKKTADKIGGTLVSYLEGIGIISVEETVQELLERLENEGIDASNIYPNYIYSVNEIGIN